MDFENIHFIINPASGNAEPILSYFDSAFLNKNIKWQVSITKHELEAYKIATKMAGTVDLIVIYGGDGSVSEVASALIGKDTPMAIIPGGTANVLSKELGIPQDSEAAIQLLVNGKMKIEEIDMGMANDCPFLIRINFGIMADMILHTNREMKNKLGQFAYGITSLQTIGEAKPTIYNLVIDGKSFTETCVALTVTNAGNLGIGDFSLAPGIDITDGYLDLLMLYDTDFLTMLQLAGSTLFQTESDILKHIRCKEISIELSQPTEYIFDDTKKTTTHLHIKVLPKALKILVPLPL